MNRRAFITALGGGAAAWSRAARAQQPGLPVIGFLHPASRDTFVERLRAFGQGLKESGYVEGESVAIVYRWGEGRLDRGRKRSDHRQLRNSGRNRPRPNGGVPPGC